MKSFKEFLDEGFRDEVKKAAWAHAVKRGYDMTKRDLDTNQPATNNSSIPRGKKYARPFASFVKSIVHHAQHHGITDAAKAVASHHQSVVDGKTYGSEKFFKHEPEIASPHHSDKGSRIERVHVQHLIPTQDDMDKEQVDQLAKRPSKSLPRLTRKHNSNHYWVNDGHHRIAGHIKSGAKFITARVRDEVQKDDDDEH